MATNLKSIAKLQKPIQYDKVIEVDRIFADPAFIEQHRQRILASFKDAKESALYHELTHIVIKDNLFSAAMNEIVSYFEFQINPEELKNVVEGLKRDVAKDADEKTIQSIAEKIIKKALVFNFLQKEWKVEVSDDIVKRVISLYYEKTNQNVREYLDDKQKFEGIRTALIEERMVLETINHFKFHFNLTGQLPS
ncbi:MPN555 family protein chaperone [Mycoplasmoides genitalium]|uniref:MPN555 family protein chaperone n=1 Tax=Mycoplasmoides genitalium TaxID=2097 RepID=UPI00405543CD